MIKHTYQFCCLSKDTYSILEREIRIPNIPFFNKIIITKIIKKFIIKNTKHLCVGVGGQREAEIDE